MSKINLSRDYEKLLRNKAEKYLRDDGSRLNRMEAMSMEEIKTTFEELEVHKIELEMQNEELKAAKSELESSKQRYFDLYNFAPVGYFTIDHKGSIAGMNLTAATMLERERDSLLKKSFSKFIALEDQDEYYLFRKKILDLGKTFSCDIRMLKKNGESFWAHLVGKLINDSINVVVSDVSDLKQAQEEIVRADKTLLAQSRQAAMGEMIYMLAHQWRQPLSVVAMSVNNVKISLALNKKISDEELNVCIDVVSGKVQQLSGTIANFISFFKPTLETEPTTVEEVLASTLGIIGKSLENNGIAISVENATKSSLSITKGSLIQVLLSLLSNAKETLLQRKVVNPAIAISAKEVNGETIVSVCDNAGGIEESAMKKLGEPYFSTKEELNGTGLGIYIAKTILEKHLRSTLKWRNEEEGACFEIALNRNLKV